MSQTIWITASKLKDLQAKLNKLKTIDFPKNREAMRAAKSGGGGMHDNAGYEQAQAYERLLLRQIKDLEELLANVQIIQRIVNPQSVCLGSAVELRNTETGEPQIVIISGYEGTDIKRNHYSYLSPFAQALIRKKVGDEVKFVPPSKKRWVFKIVSIKGVDLNEEKEEKCPTS